MRGVGAEGIATGQSKIFNSMTLLLKNLNPSPSFHLLSLARATGPSERGSAWGHRWHCCVGVVMTDEGPEGCSTHLMGRGVPSRRTVCKIPEGCRPCEVPSCEVPCSQRLPYILGNQVIGAQN